jgi:catechol 2,3-dioxygenase-like lactoylglutathione lyase family enzyme
MAGDLGKGIVAIVIGVTDLERSIAFYRDTLGLALQFQSEGLAFLSAGPVSLLLNRDMGRLRQPIAGAVEVVFGVDDVKAAWRRLVAKGITVFREPRQVTEKEWSAILTDPDGHLLSVFGPPGED